MAQEGLAPLFPGPVSQWNAAQEALAYWLKYYDSFYERVASQTHVCDVEIVKPEMAIIDFVVDAFMVWFRWKAEQKKHEHSEHREPHEAHAPRASDHEEVLIIAHQ